LETSLPRPGESVGSYRIIEQVGEGGQGTVFRAERDGRLYVVKVLHQRGLGERARREISLMSRLRHEHIARFVGSDFWPAAETGHPYLVLEHVDGVTLDAWARQSGASVRQRVSTLLKVAEAMREAHRQGVFHRDLKPENILIRHADGTPVVVDFGAGIFAGAPVVTAPGCLPLGTDEYRSPEAVRFLHGPSEDPLLSPQARWALEAEHHEASESDEVWALGVTLYWLLTHELPFGTRRESGLYGRILRQTVQPPHLRHPRVPEEASALCLRLLEKAPEARLRDDDGLCAALEELLTKRRGPAWEDALFAPLPAPVPAPAFPAAVPRVAPAPAAPPPPSRRTLAVLAGVLAAGALGLGLIHLSRGPAPVAVERATPSPVASPQTDTTPRTGTGREVVPASMPPDAGRGEIPSGASSLDTKGPGMKTDTKSPSKARLRSVSKKAVVGSACALLAGCSAPVSAVRPEKPQGEPCPPGAVENMQRLGLRLGQRDVVILLSHKHEGAVPVRVREGSTAVWLLGPFGKMPFRTVITGHLVFGAGRAYGRLTEATLPGGIPIAVCLQFRGPAELDERNMGFGGAPGVPFLRNRGPDTIGSTFDIEAVERFD
jgi:serine/threonine-protein kinase